MTRVTGAARHTFRSLHSHNYRLYFSGQIVSVSGTWMQSVALGWLVLKITGSGTWLGLVIAVQFLPMLLLGPFGGVVADRIDKRRFLFVTQALSGLLAVALGALVLTGVSASLWMVFALAARRSASSTPSTCRPARPSCSRWWAPTCSPTPSPSTASS